MKILLDSNIWISALLYGGSPRKIVVLAEQKRITLVTSRNILAEIDSVLRREKLQNRLGALAVTVDELMIAIAANSRIYEIVEIPDIPRLRDRNDKIILATALAARANSIISGDKDLLVLEEYQNIPIITPKIFLDRYFPDG